MRVFKTHRLAIDEIRRDLAERGIRVHPETMQDKDVADSPDFETIELSDYSYSVLDALDFDGLDPTQPWADAEFNERVAIPKTAAAVNPGHAWRDRRDVWEEFLEPNGLFSYTYHERFGSQLLALEQELVTHPHSRQLFLGMWRPFDADRLGKRRVPCSLGYQLLYRDGKVHLTYFQRSADFATHFRNDVYLACRLLGHVANRTKKEPGRFTHHITSLHVYQKDVRGVF